MNFLALALVAATLATSVLSGIFGMAGGLILMGFFAWFLPVLSALALHGIIQFASNCWRGILYRRHLAWAVLMPFGVGAVAAMVFFSLVAFTPTKLYIFLGLGLMPILVWMPERWLRLDASRPSHALGAGFVSTGLSLVSGVSGPVTDLFFIRTALTRHQVVATKAMMQAVGHASKIVAYGAVLLSPASRAQVSLPLIGACIVASMAGIMLGGLVLDRMTDDGFRTWRRWIVTVVGLSFLAQAAEIAFG